MEGNGSGIQFMINETTTRGLRPPEFHPSIDHFKIVFFLPETLRSRTAGVRAGEALVEALLKGRRELSLREIAERSGLTVSQARRRVNALIDEGTFEAMAPAMSRSRKYRIARR